LNELLVGLDGFKDTNGIFLICATNRVDLLDSALIRPGRIDKKIFIGPPDSKTRSAIINIHIKGKPYEGNVDIDKLVENTNGLSGAQIENILNEAMLNALRDNRFFMNSQDIELIINRVISGWQSSEHEYTEDIIRCIAIHEMGHAIVGMFCKHHSKLKKIVINLQSPNTPAYTIFETSTTNIQTKQQLLEQLMILLSGRIAEELFFGKSITTGAINDFDEATKLAQKMIVYYGMGNKIIYPNSSDKYKEMIDTEIFTLINDAHQRATFIIKNTKELILESSFILMKEKTLNLTDINALIAERYPNILNINI
jgi:cell division protease FtsH